MDGVLDIQNRINNTLLERGVATNAAAFKQKWATGMDIPRDPTTGKEVEPYEASVRRVWIAESPETKFGEFAESDLTNYIQLIESDVNALAAISKTPPTYLLGAMVNLSGDAIRTAEVSLIKKVTTRLGFLSESWEEVMRLALLFLGDPRGDDTSSEILWADPAVRTEGELVDALTKMKTLGVPLEELWRRWGATEQQIRQWKANEAVDQFAALLNPTPVPQPAPPVPTPVQ